jgi:hypothetical protein
MLACGAQYFVTYCCMHGCDTQVIPCADAHRNLALRMCHVPCAVCCMQGCLHGMQRDNLPVYNGSVTCPSWQPEVTQANIWVNSDGATFK